MNIMSKVLMTVVFAGGAMVASSKVGTAPRDGPAARMPPMAFLVVIEPPTSPSPGVLHDAGTAPVIRSSDQNIQSG